jgi:hypothetical protein
MLYEGGSVMAGPMAFNHRPEPKWAKRGGCWFEALLVSKVYPDHETVTGCFQDLRDFPVDHNTLVAVSPGTAGYDAYGLLEGHSCEKGHQPSERDQVIKSLDG